MGRSKRTIGFLTTTAIGGLLFLLPLIVIGALIGQVAPIVLTVAESLGDIIPVETPGGIILLILLAILIVLLLCFAAGLLARYSFGKRISEWFEKSLLLFFPRYAILRDQMADSVGGRETRPRMKPIIVRFEEFRRLGFEIERTEDGLVTVYLPGSPDPWSGSAVMLAADRVQPAHAEFGEAVATCERLVHGAASLLAGRRSTIEETL
jgi:uncharacterized membrane protein